MNITLYCSASDNTTPEIKQQARRLGQWIGTHGHSLIYGGIPLGLMKITAEAARDAGAKTIGIVPHSRRENAATTDTQTIIADNLNHRKQIMIDNADVFIALPGGYGTLDEIITTFATNNFHNTSRPIIIVNENGLYDPLRQQLKAMADARLLHTPNTDTLIFVKNIDEAIEHLEHIIG